MASSGILNEAVEQWLNRGVTAALATDLQPKSIPRDFSIFGTFFGPSTITSGHTRKSKNYPREPRNTNSRVSQVPAHSPT